MNILKISIVSSIILALSVHFSLSNSLNADNQSVNDQNTDHTAYMKTLSGLITDTNDTKIMAPPDSLTVKLLTHFNQWRASSSLCEILLSDSSFRERAPAKSEIDERTSCYKQAFPAIPITQSYIINEILSEKYIIQKTGITAPENETVKIYNDYTKTTPLKQPPLISTIRPILRCKAIMSTDTVIRLCKQLKLQKQEKNRLQMAEKMKPWAYEEISLKTDPVNCIVTDPQYNQCIVSVAEFNSFLSMHKMLHFIELDTARVKALKDLLTKLFFAYKGELAGVSKSDSLIRTQELWEESKRLSMEQDSHPADSICDSLLVKTYNKYYDLFFAGKTVRQVGIIGSSDSSFIDSLCKPLFSDSGKRINGIRHYINSLPWTITTSDKLPDTLRSLADTLRRGQITSRINTPFGFFICRLQNVYRQKEITFREARSKTRYLYLAEKKKYNEKPDSIIALEYYRKNADQFITADTLIVEAHLVQTDSLTYQTNDTLQLQKLISRDTAQISSILISSDRLPPVISAELQKRFKIADNKKELIGPFFSTIGTWYFSVRKCIPGARKIPFDSVCQSICRNELRIKRLPFDSIQNTETAIRICNQITLADAYRSFNKKALEEQVKNIPDKDIEKLIADKSLRISYENGQSTDKQLLNIARDMILDKKHEQENAQLNSWLATLIIDSKLLSSDGENKH